MSVASRTSTTQQSYTIAQITDTHLMATAQGSFVKMNPEQSFQAVLDHIFQLYPQVDAIVHTGDLAQEAVPETYQRYIEKMQHYQIPFFQIPGNHDLLSAFPLPEGQQFPYCVEYGTWCFILLNTAVPEHVDGLLDSAQLEQLDVLLQQHQQQHVIICGHHHPFDMNSTWIDQHKLKNTEALMAVLCKHDHIKLMLCGHVHQESQRTEQNIPCFSCPSTCVQFKPLSHDFALDTVHPGFRILHLHADGRFETQVHRLIDAPCEINTEISGY